MDPVYAVGSFYFEGKAYPHADVVETARGMLEAMIKPAEAGEHGWTSRDARELRMLVRALDYYMVADYATRPRRDTEHRYAPPVVVCRMREAIVRRWVFHPAGSHNGPIVATSPAVEAVTDYGSRWYGCDRAYINAELRFVVIGFDARDEVRATWPIVPKRLQVGS